jgi:hypothetical protein
MSIQPPDLTCGDCFALSRHFFEFSVITSPIDRAFSAASRAISRIYSSSRSFSPVSFSSITVNPASDF